VTGFDMFYKIIKLYHINYLQWFHANNNH